MIKEINIWYYHDHKGESFSNKKYFTSVLSKWKSILAKSLIAKMSTIYAIRAKTFEEGKKNCVKVIVPAKCSISLSRDTMTKLCINEEMISFYDLFIYFKSISST